MGAEPQVQTDTVATGLQSRTHSSCCCSFEMVPYGSSLGHCRAASTMWAPSLKQCTKESFWQQPKMDLGLWEVQDSPASEIARIHSINGGLLGTPDYLLPTQWSRSWLQVDWGDGVGAGWCFAPFSKQPSWSFMFHNVSVILLLHSSILPQIF